MQNSGTLPSLRPVPDPSASAATTVCLRFRVTALRQGALSPPPPRPRPRVGLRPGFVFLPSSLQPLLADHLLGQT